MSMELTPSHIAAAQFRTVRKGYDPDEVDGFLGRAAKALEDAQQQATAMEARARAAVARLQEVTAEGAATAPAAPESPAAPPRVEMQVGPDEAETISRTLLLAQRTADTTVAEARSEADRILGEARVEADSTIDSTREMSAKLLEDARAEARRAGEAERVAAASEVESLTTRRQYLVGDVDHLEQFLAEQRERLRAAARQIEALCDRVPAGLGSVPAPAVSIFDTIDDGTIDDGTIDDDTGEHERPGESTTTAAVGPDVWARTDNGESYDGG